MNGSLSTMEKRVVENEKRGQEWVSIHAEWLQLDEGKKSYLASLINDLEKGIEGKLSEAKLERLARGSKAYMDYITGMCVARAEELRAKVRYDSACEMFRAMQSVQAFAREKLRHLGEVT